MKQGLPYPQGCTLRINIQQRIFWEKLLETLGDAQPEYEQQARGRHILYGRHDRMSGGNAFPQENDETQTKGHTPRPHISRQKEV